MTAISPDLKLTRPSLLKKDDMLRHSGRYPRNSTASLSEYCQCGHTWRNRCFCFRGGPPELRGLPLFYAQMHCPFGNETFCKDRQKFSFRASTALVVVSSRSSRENHSLVRPYESIRLGFWPRLPGLIEYASQCFT